MDFTTLTGKIISRIDGCEISSERVLFTDVYGTAYHLVHYQGCFEDVRLEEIHGDVANLVGAPILLAEEIVGETGDKDFKSYTGSYTWTFYKLSTIRGSVTLRFLGESNGYYSERVTFEEVPDDFVPSADFVASVFRNHPAEALVELKKIPNPSEHLRQVLDAAQVNQKSAERILSRFIIELADEYHDEVLDC